MRPTACVILAAGKGKRMQSALPKVLHPIAGDPMLSYSIRLAKSLRLHPIVTVIGHGGEAIQRCFQGQCKFVWQRRPKGTGDALEKAYPLLRKFKGDIVVLCGDAPLVTRSTVAEMIRQHQGSRASVTLLSGRVDVPLGYGRIVRDHEGMFCDIREEKDATAEERQVTEVNTGAYVFRASSLWTHLEMIRAHNRQRERYLTDTPRLMKEKGLGVHVVTCLQGEEAMGINSRSELAEAGRILNQRILRSHMQNGVTVVSPENTFIARDVKIGRDTVIYPFTYIENSVRIGSDCKVGPFCKLRSGTMLEDGAIVGSFVEVVRTRIGKKTNVKHLTYLGDARVGNRVNIGAGTITANFDGKRKQTTTIADGAFIGCDTVLIAPVKVGRRARTGAGTVVPRGRNVQPGATVVGAPSRPIGQLKKAKRKST